MTKEREVDEKYETWREFAKELLKTELTFLQVNFARQQKFINDNNVEMIN